MTYREPQLQIPGFRHTGQYRKVKRGEWVQIKAKGLFTRLGRNSEAMENGEARESTPATLLTGKTLAAEAE